MELEFIGVFKLCLLNIGHNMMVIGVFFCIQMVEFDPQTRRGLLPANDSVCGLFRHCMIALHFFSFLFFFLISDRHSTWNGTNDEGFQSGNLFFQDQTTNGGRLSSMVRSIQVFSNFADCLRPQELYGTAWNGHFTKRSARWAQ